MAFNFGAPAPAAGGAFSFGGAAPAPAPAFGFGAAPAAGGFGAPAAPAFGAAAPAPATPFGAPAPAAGGARNYYIPLSFKPLSHTFIVLDLSRARVQVRSPSAVAHNHLPLARHHPLEQQHPLSGRRPRRPYRRLHLEEPQLPEASGRRRLSRRPLALPQRQRRPSVPRRRSVLPHRRRRLAPRQQWAVLGTRNHHISLSLNSLTYCCSISLACAVLRHRLHLASAPLHHSERRRPGARLWRGVAVGGFGYGTGTRLRGAGTSAGVRGASPGTGVWCGCDSKLWSSSPNARSRRRTLRSPSAGSGVWRLRSGAGPSAGGRRRALRSTGACTGSCGRSVWLWRRCGSDDSGDRWWWSLRRAGACAGRSRWWI